MSTLTIRLPDDKRISLCCPAAQDEISATAAGLGLFNFRRALLLPLSGGFGLQRERYTALFRFIEQEIQDYWQNKMTLIHMAPLWIKNIFTKTLAFMYILVLALSYNPPLKSKLTFPGLSSV